MTKTEFQQLKTPVILQERFSPNRHTYYKVTSTTPDPSGSEGLSICFDLRVVRVQSSRYMYGESTILKCIYFYPQPATRNVLTTSVIDSLTVIPWSQAKREILDLLLG